MQIEFPNAQPLTPDDEQHLATIKTLIEKSIADGVLTGEEVVLIRDTMAANKKFLPEGLTLVKTLIHDKINRGDLETDLFDRLF